VVATGYTVVKGIEVKTREKVLTSKTSMTKMGKWTRGISAFTINYNFQRLPTPFYDLQQRRWTSNTQYRRGNRGAMYAQERFFRRMVKNGM
jgi:hypothetical protein